MFDAVCLSSGGLDSLVCLYMLRDQGIRALPLFIDYGQLNRGQEFASLQRGVTAGGLLEPVVLNISGYGTAIKSGLTDEDLRLVEDAFTPNRNLLFLTLAAAFAYTKGVRNLVLGFLSERTAIFPDQTDRFLAAAQAAISESLGVEMTIICPLRDLVKAEVLTLSKHVGVLSFYSCHAGAAEPCGRCIACLEYKMGA